MKIIYTVSSKNMVDSNHEAYSSAEKDFAIRRSRYDTDIKIVEHQTNFLGKTTSSIILKEDIKESRRKIGF